MTLQCTNCPGATDHSTSQCWMVPDNLSAGSAQARSGDVYRENAPGPAAFDWRAEQQRRELEAANMRVRVLGAVGIIEMKLGMAGKGHP